MMRRTSSATRFSVVSRSRDVLTASATSSRKDSTLAGEAGCVWAVSTLPMIPAGPWEADNRRIKWVLATPQGHPLHLFCEDRPRPDQHHDWGFQRQRG